MFKKLMILLGKSEIFIFNGILRSREDLINQLPNKPNILGQDSWSVIAESRGSSTIRLNAFNKYGLPPHILIKEMDNKKLEVKLFFSSTVKAVIYFWLFICILFYPALAFYIANEFMSGDGVLNVTVNGTEKEVSFFLWVPLFFLTHFLVFFLAIASAFWRGWGASKRLIFELVG